MGATGGRFPEQRKQRRRRLADAALGLIFTGAVLAAPSPAVSLDTLIAPPPSLDFVQDTESAGTPVGAFDAAAYASYVGADPSTVLSTLNRDGFAGGYGASWTAQTNGWALASLVVAFAGGRGARSWLGTAEAAARSSDYYKSSFTVAGIGPFYAVHFANPSGPTYADVVSFVKGNNFFTVGFISTADDLGRSAALQAKKQFDFAPADSIPPQQWPENLGLLAGGVQALKVAGAVIAGVILLGFLASSAVFFYVRKRGSGSTDGKLSLDGESQPPGG